MPATLRSFFGAVAAVPIALGLFYLMQSLIDTQFEQEDVKTRKIADIVVPDKVIETNLKEVLPEKVEDPDEPPPDMEPLDFDTDLDMSTANMAPTVAVTVNIMRQAYHRVMVSTYLSLRSRRFIRDVRKPGALLAIAL
jgi:protein TonB